MVSGKDETADRPDRESESQPGPGAAQPEPGFGPALNDFGPPVRDSGAAPGGFGPPVDDSESDPAGFGPALNDFGPSLNDFGPAVEPGAAGWAPAGEPASPDLAWRPADAPPSVPAPPPQYRAPDSWTPPATGQYPPVGGESPATGQYSPVAPQQPSTGQYPPVGGQYPSGAGADPTVVANPVAGSAQQSAAAASNSGAAVQSSGAGSAGSWWRDSGSDGFPPTPPPERAESQADSLSWADDPIGRALAPKNVAPQGKSPEEEKPAPPWGKIAAGVGAVVALVVAAGVVVAVTSRDGGSDDQAATSVVPATSTAKQSVTTSSAPAELSCPTKREGNLTIGNGPGSTASGADAILGFQHAYYSERSGVKALSFVAPGSNVLPADVMQGAIDQQIPPGTTYCVRILQVQPEQFDVDVTEHRPDGTTTVYRPHITTVNLEGRNLIQAIQYPE
ncbi:hypothetical protein [Nocardia huaxiensis]|uniref:DUF8176 domain-containing protein n=1 Tax=Nocardia huaxiensis TaxID=2755382 RepID=A0A7D6VL52_9NOCA|nr:hypothetical protein [Nocardia huaxiensis]QLY32030.1 hypothetical protein H0264_06965 [Nocardia huaxiensis]UFS95604.1 hypothetical protein LPY97_33855 [Nocardia huaxiensis]